MHYRSVFWLIVALLVLCAATAVADVPQMINYQGVLLDTAGDPVTTQVTVTFTIYDDATAWTPQWSDVRSLTPDDEGRVNILLGQPANPIGDGVFAGPNRWLGVQVESDPEMTPRAQIVTVAYAHRVSTVDGSSGGTIAGDVSISGGNLSLDNSSAGAGNILKGGDPFIHDFGTDNTFIGSGAGNFTMTGNKNTASGAGALFSNTTGDQNTASGYRALYKNTTSNSNTASGFLALYNTTGAGNTASGWWALRYNTTGAANTAIGFAALTSNTTGSYNTALGSNANVASGDLTNATAIGYFAEVDASNKIRLGNGSVTVIEGQVAYTFTSDKNDKENFRPVDGDEVLRKIRGLDLTSWNYIGHDPRQFRHYGPVAQDFFTAFGHDDVGTIGTPTTINSGDMAGILMIAVQALEKRTAEVEDLRAQIAELHYLVDRLLEQNR